MARQGKRNGEDIFLELAQDSAGVEDDVRPPSRSERIASRLSRSGKRRSLPPEDVVNISSVDRRPKSSGNMFARPVSRFGELPSDLQGHVNRYRSTPSRGSIQPDDAMSTSVRSLSGRHQKSSAVQEASPMSPSRFADRIRSPELPQFGRRRPSFSATDKNQSLNKAQDSQDESPADSSEPKLSNPDSLSVESQTADTVWDELDDLKSRIKKLELTGKLPTTSGAAVSGDSSERPRTATTAPTTIDSSPKHERKPEGETPQSQPAPENTVGGPGAANIHPLLHSALAKAKPLLNATLYRTLEATASDALQLAAMTGSAGPQGTAYSAASIINGVTVSDRHVRRKADTMCRNLTDLCLALCDGKHEAPSVTASPITLNTPAKSSPSARYSRSSLGPPDALSRSSSNSRPMSRLEARRSSILGVQAVGSPRDSGEDVSASEQESTPSQPKPQEPSRPSRTGNRLLTPRLPRYDEVSGDEDPTIRPPSRAFTDVGSGLRAKPNGPRDFSPRTERSAKLRDSFTAQRANGGAFDSNQNLSRVSSLTSDTGRRRFFDRSTPVVPEEESPTQDYQPSAPSQSKRRITSLGQFGSKRSPAANVPSRTTSLQQRRHVAVEPGF